MNRNNFLPHVALALVLILVAAFAGQVRKWRQHWHVRRGVAVMRTPRLQAPPVVPVLSKHGEVFVRFRSGVSQDEIASITRQLNDEIEDRTEAVTGLDLIQDEDGNDAATVAAEYSALPQVEYA